MTKRLTLILIILLISGACASMPAPQPPTALPVIEVTVPGMFLPATGTPESAPQPQAAPATETAATEAAQPAAPVPTLQKPSDMDTTPEGTVERFLYAFQYDQPGMVNYLSANLKSQVPAEGARAILEATGSLQGYLFKSGKMEPDKGTAEVEVGMIVDEVEISRGFILIQENGVWVIDRIDFKNN